MKRPSGHVKKKLRERGRRAGIQVQIRRASRSEIPRLDWRRPQFLLSGCGWKPVLTAAAAWVFLAGCSGLCRLRPYRCVLAACITVAQLETGQGVCCQSHCHQLMWSLCCQHLAHLQQILGFSVWRGYPPKRAVPCWLLPCGRPRLGARGLPAVFKDSYTCRGMQTENCSSLKLLPSWPCCCLLSSDSDFILILYFIYILYWWWNQTRQLNSYLYLIQFLDRPIYKATPWTSSFLWASALATRLMRTYG